MQNQTKLSVILMTAVMFASVFCAIGITDTDAAEAPEGADTWDGTTTTTGWTGDGTETNPYIIDSAEKLAGLAQNVNNGTTYSGKHFLLTVDIDLSECSWTPIGKYDADASSNPSFNGTFDGNSETIFGMSVSNVQSGGLFGALVNATVENLTISNADVSSTRYASAIAGYVSGATINGCEIIDSTIGCTGSYAGGLGGVVYGTDFSGCTVSGTSVSSGSFAAPMVGLLSSDSEMTESVSRSNTVSGTTVGGIAGNTYESVTVSNSYVDGLTVQSGTKVGHAFGNLVETLTVTNVTYLGAFTGTDIFIDDGSNPAIVQTTDSDSGFSYYYGTISDATEGASGETTLTLIEDATFSGHQTVPSNVKLTITGSMTVEYGAVLEFESKDSIPASGEINIEGVVELSYSGAVASDIASISSGTGSIMIDGAAYEPGTGDVDSDASDTTWYDDSKEEFTLTSTIQLVGFATLVNEGETFTGKTVKLGNDIDLAGIDWTPIGVVISKGAHLAFSGTFDGQNYKISNISTDIDDGRAVGFFGYLAKGIIKNTNIENATVSGSYAAGALVGFVDITAPKIIDCSVTNSKVSTTGTYAGGMVGQGYDLDMTGCSVTGSSIESSDRMGGLIGLSYSGTSIENCHVENIDISGKYGAGLVGQTGSDCSLSESYVDGLTVTKGAVVYPTVYNGNLSEVPSVTYMNLDQDFRFSDDGTKASLIKIEDTDDTYFYGDIGAYLEDHPDATSVRLIEGAVLMESFDNLTVPLEITDNARIEFGTSIAFIGDAGLPASGTLVVDGAILIQTIPSSVSCTLEGEGFILSMDDGIPVAYGLDLQPLDADLSWILQDTRTTTYTLDSAADLRGLELMVNHVGVDYRDVVFTLGADIDLEDKEWDPIGAGTYPFTSTDTPFNGTFDGSGYTIRNLNVNLPDTSMVGLFGLVREGTLSNIILENANVTGDDFVGGIVGWYGNAYPDRYDPAGTLSGCRVIGDVDINGRCTVGGLVGELIADASDNRVEANTGSNVIGTGDNIGGFAGYVQRHDASEGSTDVGDMDDIAVSGLTVQGSGEVGGVIGSVTSYIAFRSCSATDMTIIAVEGDQEDHYMPGIGGLFGTFRGSGASVNSCSVENTRLIPNGQPAGYITGVPREDTVFENVSYTDDCTGANVEDPSGTIVNPGAGDSQFPPYPWWDDDDDYVPPVVPSQTEDSGDDDTTTIVACAAAAVVAALMAAFLIIERRRN